MLAGAAMKALLVMLKNSVVRVNELTLATEGEIVLKVRSLLERVRSSRVNSCIPNGSIGLSRP